MVPAQQSHALALFFLLTVTSGCAMNEREVSDEENEALENPVLLESTQRILFDMPGVAPGSIPIPESWTEAKAESSRAAELYRSQQYEAAAEAYLSVAAKLTEGGSYETDFSVAREVAYQNVALCYLEAEAPKAGRERLSHVDDPAAAEGLAEAMAMLE